MTLLTTLMFALVPALHTTRLEICGSLAGGGRRVTAGRGALQFRRGLVVVQIATALTLLVGAWLLTRSFVSLTALDPGFDHENILVVRAFPDEAVYASSERRLVYFNALAERLDALPSVESVGATTGLPLNDFNNAPARPYWPEGQPRPGADGPTANLKMTTKNYFRTIGLSLLAGRDFTDRGQCRCAARRHRQRRVGEATLARRGRRRQTRRHRLRGTRRLSVRDRRRRRGQ